MDDPINELKENLIIQRCRWFETPDFVQEIYLPSVYIESFNILS